MKKILPLLVLLAACGDTTPRRDSTETFEMPQPSRSSVALAPGDSLVCSRCVLVRVDTSTSIVAIDTTFGSQVDTTWRDSTVTPPPPPPVDTTPPPVDTTTPPPPPTTGLPPGFSLIGLQDCTQRKPSGWTERGDTALSIFMDPVRGPVCRATFRAGFSGGRGPVQLNLKVPSSGSLFLSFYLRLSPNFQTHPSGVNKIFHLWIGGGGQVGNKMYLSCQGGAFQAQVRLQGMAETPVSRNLTGSQRCARGKWVRWDIVTTANTGGQANGTVQWWIDGVSSGRETNLRFFTTANPTWRIVSWNPTWGGVGGNVSALMTMDIDDLLIAVAP